MAKINREYNHLAKFPKPGKRRKLRLVRKGGTSEKSIQDGVEAYLRLKGLKFFHCPDEVYRLCGDYRTPIQTKKAISEAFKGMPDLMIFKNPTYLIGGDNIPCNTEGCDVLFLELKKKNAKARDSQRNWHGELNMNVCDTFFLPPNTFCF